jgi:putative membrane protein
MNGIMIRTLICMLGLLLASYLISGVWISGALTFVFAAVLLGLVNGVTRPIMLVLTLPLAIITLGLFIFVLNAAMFGLVAALLDNFYVSVFWAAVFGALIVSITSMVASWTIGPDGRYQLVVVRRR